MIRRIFKSGLIRSVQIKSCLTERGLFKRDLFKRDLNAKVIQALSDVAIFMIITVVLHYSWWNFFDSFRQTLIYHQMASFLATNVYQMAYHVDKMLGLRVTSGALVNTLYFTNGKITVAESCSGFKQLYQILGLFLLFPGRWKLKIWYIPFSWLVMHGVNIFRIVILSFALLYLPQYWDFIHLWILRPMFYVVIFCLWLIFIKNRKRITKS